ALDLRELAAYAPQPTAASGRLEASGSARGTFAAPAVVGTASGRRLVVQDWPLDSVDAHFAYATGASRADWKAAAFGGGVSGEARLANDQLEATAPAHKRDTRRAPRRGAAGAPPPP